MKTYLLTWNATKWSWEDPFYGYEELINDINQVGFAYSKWTCGVNKSIKNGDRIFLIKLGSEPRGIVASGFALTSVFEGNHWDDSKRGSGIKARRIIVKFDKIKNFKKEKLIEFEELHEISDIYKWSSQSSGVLIPDEIAKKIEVVWKNS